MGFSTRPGIENFKKTAEKFKKLENTIIASFPTKIGWEGREREKKTKKIIPIYAYPTGNRKFQTNSRKNSKN